MAKRFLSFTKGYRILTLLCPFLIYFDVLIELKIPEAMGDVVDILTNIASSSDPAQVRSALFNKLLEMFIYCFATLIVGYIASRFSAIASMGFGANLRRELFFKIQDLSFDNIDKLKISSLITRMTSDVSMCQSVYKSTIVTFIKGPIMLFKALDYALEISRDLSKMFVVALPAIVIILGLMGYLAVPLFKQMLEKTDKFNSVLRGNINGIRVVKSFVREDYEKEQFRKANENLMEMNIRAQKIMLYISPLIMMVIYGCMVFALWNGSKLILAGGGDFTLGEMTTFVSYISTVLTSILTVLIVFLSMIMSKASIGRIGEIFKQEPSVKDDEGKEGLTLSDGSIEYRNVSFKYEESAKNILENVSLSIRHGETIGIIGSTGSAKSTLVQLIPRLYDVTDGELIVGGNNVKDYKFKNLRDEISVVLQQNILFSGTVRENIRWGCLDATDEEIIEAAKAAQAHDFIMDLEKGYDTELGQGGNTVSGGQRQRLCIARALLKKSKILIFDDCTSAVDTATDAKIKMALRSEKYKDITKIIIAQRITSIMDADRIIVVENGRIESIGTHEQLTQSSAVYKEIFLSQQEGVLAQ